MSLIVADASVTVKWFQRGADEADSEKALALLPGIKNDDLTLCQPAHWLAEVSAVLARLNPATALDDIDDLYAIRFRRIENRSVYTVACTLSRDLNHHLFDTLYHAVALSLTDAVLVTADQHYFDKAQRYGSISLLADFKRRCGDEQILGRRRR